MNRVKNLWKSGSKGKLISIFVGFILTTVVCGFCGLLANFASPSDGIDEVPEIINSQEEDINVEPTITIADTYIPENLIEAVNIVADGLGNNVLDIKETDLLSIENPKGDGVFVYVEQTRFSGVERYIIWLVLDETPYALNGATKDVTPSYLWPREAKDDTWSRTNLDMYQATEAIEIVFGN